MALALTAVVCGMAAVRAEGRQLRATALNDDRVVIPFEDAQRHDVIIATRNNGVPMAVRDTGSGMDASTLSRLFQRLQQADPSITRRYGGSGLGLDISRTLARLMGGDVQAESQPGAGSTFTATWVTPIAAPEATPSDFAVTQTPGWMDGPPRSGEHPARCG